MNFSSSMLILLLVLIRPTLASRTCVRDCRGGVAVRGLATNEATAESWKARPRASGGTPKTNI